MVCAATVAIGGLSGCSLSDLVSGNSIPPDLRDPNVIKNRAGAIGAYHQAISALSTAVGVSNGVVQVTGTLTDEIELRYGSSVIYPINGLELVDNRTMPDNDFSVAGRRNLQATTTSFLYLHDVRVTTREALGALRKYASDAPPSMIGHLYAIEALAQVYLAELYCSGIPLTTLDFETGYTPTRGFTTAEVYRNSLHLLDTALTLAKDSARITHFVNLVRSRAHIAMGQYDSAAVAIRQVPTEYQYAATYGASSPNLFRYNGVAIVGDLKGRNGLPFRSSTDPRITVTIDPNGEIISAKYSTTGLTPIIMSSGVEARLVEAEFKLHSGDITSWLASLNELRTSGISTVSPNPGNPAINDTVWTPGSGASLFVGRVPSFPGLPPLSDPGTDSARVSLLFHERAFWLFLTGTRQGDLRRLVRNYQRPEYQVYPSGPWGPQGIIEYGSHVNLPIPVDEQERNRLYQGCVNRDA